MLNKICNELNPLTLELSPHDTHPFTMYMICLPTVLTAIYPTMLGSRVSCKQLLTNLLLVVMETCVVSYAIFVFEGVEAFINITMVVIFVKEPAPWIAWIIRSVSVTYQ